MAAVGAAVARVEAVGAVGGTSARRARGPHSRAPSAGSVVVFDKDLWHAGGGNLSSSIRYALYYRLRFEADQSRAEPEARCA